MKAVKNHFNEAIYHYQTESLLDVWIVHRPEFKRSSAAYGTHFGALDLMQQVDGQTIHHPQGAAHFLEHKLFEDEKQDVLAQFSDLGAEANAFTSYFETVYYFNINDDIQKPLELLLNFVSHLQISQASVDKEKGIIVEEIKMYEQVPDMQLLNETYKNIYHSYPFIYDILGTVASVEAMTQEDLETAYRLNYADSKMMLVVLSDKDPEMIKAIVDAQTASHVHNEQMLKTIFEPEPATVVHKEREITGNVMVPKMSLVYKFVYQGTESVMTEFSLYMLLEANFSDINPEYQGWLDTGIITEEGFAYDVDIRDGIGVVYFMNESEQPETFKALIQNMMAKLTLNETHFEQLLKRNYGAMIFSLGRGDRLTLNLLRYHFAGLDYFDYLEKVRRLKYTDVAATLMLLKDVEESFLVMQPNPAKR